MTCHRKNFFYFHSINPKTLSNNKLIKHILQDQYITFYKQF